MGCLLPAKYMITSEEEPSCSREHGAVFFLSFPPSSGSAFHGKETQACRADRHISVGTDENSQCKAVFCVLSYDRWREKCPRADWQQDLLLCSV